jgi:hypothetical protein
MVVGLVPPELLLAPQPLSKRAAANTQGTEIKARFILNLYLPNKWDFSGLILSDLGGVA